MPWCTGDVPESMNRMVFGPEHECYVEKTARLSGALEIGRYTYISENAVMIAHSPIRIGSFCSIGANFHCVTHEQHPTQFPTTFPLSDILGMNTSHGGVIGLDRSKRVTQDLSVNIGNDVWIGDSASVFGGVTVGHGCVIGAKSLINRDCEPYGIYAGTPGRLIRKRFPDRIIEQLLELKWWDWSLGEIRSNLNFFETDLAAFQGDLRDLIASPKKLVNVGW